jgi:hypothetical protein
MKKKGTTERGRAALSKRDLLGETAIERLEFIEGGIREIYRDKVSGKAFYRGRTIDGREVEIVLPGAITIGMDELLANGTENEVRLTGAIAEVMDPQPAGSEKAASMREFCRRAATDLDALRAAASEEGVLIALHRVLDGEIGLSQALPARRFSELRVLPSIPLHKSVTSNVRHRFRSENARRLIKAVMQSCEYNDFERRLAVQWVARALAEKV